MELLMDSANLFVVVLNIPESWCIYRAGFKPSKESPWKFTSATNAILEGMNSEVGSCKRLIAIANRTVSQFGSTPEVVEMV